MRLHSRRSLAVTCCGLKSPFRGCIYHLGVDSGTLIEGNICTNTSAYYYGGWGYYLDEGSSNVTVRGNLAFDLKTAGFTQHCAHA